MQETKQIFNKNKDNNEVLRKNYITAFKDKKVLELRKRIHISDEILEKHVPNLIDSAIQFDNCLNCKGLQNCKNEIQGYCYYPKEENNTITFSYVACKYKNNELKKDKYKENIDLYNVPTSIKNACMKDLYTDDKSRIEPIKYINNYYNTYNTNRQKGLYLYGNFGSGKTYIIAALLNEFAKKDIKSAIIYFPEFLRTLKESFSNDENISYSEKYEYIKKIPILLIDDIGAENVTSWGRDEILGTILQYRMDENLPTFFTSNLSLEELETHLSNTNKTIDKVKARRIIERIKYLSTEMKMIGVNRRWKTY